jgi:hypothetical protein
VAVEQRREQALSSFGPRADFFTLNSGQIAVVRFLEQGEELAYAASHRVQYGSSKYPNDVLCLDQQDDGTPCPMCSHEDKEIRSRSTKGFVNVIWRGGAPIQQVNQQILAQNQQRMAQQLSPYLTYSLAPVYKRSQQGLPETDPQTKAKIITGYADGVFLWKCSNTVFQELMSKDSTYRGLMSCDFTVRRQGSTMQDTAYFVEPYDVNNVSQPMSATDMALAAAKYDLEPFITPEPLENIQKILSGNVATSGPQETFMRGGMPGMPPSIPTLVPAVPQVGGVNPFEQGAQPMHASMPPIPPPNVA